MYSRLYLRPDAFLKDSDRFRIRMAGYYTQFLDTTYHLTGQFAKAVQLELGVTVPMGYNGYLVSDFFRKAELRDILSAITIIFRLLKISSPATGNSFREFTGRAIAEEQLGFRLDSKCGVHPLIDTEFERNRIATLSGLGLPRYSAVGAAFDMAFDKLEQAPIDGKGALRDMFEATEIIFKLLTGSNASLDAGAVKKDMQSLIDKTFADEIHARSTATRLVLSFADWVNAIHPFRHGQKTEEPVTVPDDLLVLMMSQGAGFIRWLVDLDQRVQRGPATTQPA